MKRRKRTCVALLGRRASAAVLSIAALSISKSAAARCPADSLEVLAQLSDAHSAFKNASAEFAREMDDAEELLSCLDERASMNLAANYHWLRALQNHEENDLRDSAYAIRALTTLRAGAELPSEIAASDLEFARAYALAQAAGEGDARRARGLGAATLVVDGRESNLIPVDRAAILQLEEASGEISWTTYHAPGDLLGPISYRGMDRGSQSTYRRTTSDLHRTFLVSGASMAVLGLGAGFVALDARSSFFALDCPCEEGTYERSQAVVLRDRTNAFSTVSLVLLLGGAGSLGGALATR